MGAGWLTVSEGESVGHLFRKPGRRPAGRHGAGAAAKSLHLIHTQADRTRDWAWCGHE